MDNRTRHRTVDSIRSGIALLALLFPVTAVLSDDSDPILDLARRRVEPIRMERAVDDEWREAPRIEQPVLRFEERSRNNSGGSVWLWSDTGRPAAVMELYQPADKPQDWAFVLNNLSGGRIRALREADTWWQENDSGIEMTPFAEAPDPAPRASARLLQMRALARRFQTHEFWDPDHSRFNLRLLPRPLHRYADGDQGIRDGTLFVFANGTNPEACLLIEARGGDDANPAWYYGLARLGHAEIHVHLDGESVWEVPLVRRTPNGEPYWLWYATFPVTSNAEAAQQSTAP